MPRQKNMQTHKQHISQLQNKRTPLKICHIKAKPHRIYVKLEWKMIRKYVQIHLDNSDSKKWKIAWDAICRKYKTTFTKQERKCTNTKHWPICSNNVNIKDGMHYCCNLNWILRIINNVTVVYAAMVVVEDRGEWMMMMSEVVPDITTKLLHMHTTKAQACESHSTKRSAQLTLFEWAECSKYWQHANILPSLAALLHLADMS